MYSNNLEGRQGSDLIQYSVPWEYELTNKTTKFCFTYNCSTHTSRIYRLLLLLLYVFTILNLASTHNICSFPPPTTTQVPVICFVKFDYIVYEYMYSCSPPSAPTIQDFKISHLTRSQLKLNCFCLKFPQSLLTWHAP